MMRWLVRDPRIQASGAGLLAAMALVVASGWRAVRHQPISVPPTDRVAAIPAADPTLASGYSLARVMDAVDKDPFHPARRRPGKRFQLPGDLAAMAARQHDSDQSSVRLIGTAVNGNGGGFAMCALQGGTPRIVRVGEHVGQWTLTKVTPGAAEFATPAGSVVIRVPKPGEGT